jgi:phosphodiesterase/alkaline phosphatase D-like protein
MERGQSLSPFLFLFHTEQIMRTFFLLFFFLIFSAQLFSQMITAGPVIGAVTSNSARIMIQYDQPGTYQITLMPGMGAVVGVEVSAMASESKNNIAIFDVKGLQSGRTYKIESYNAVDNIDVGVFKTFKEDQFEEKVTFTFGSCIENVLTDSIFIEMDKHHPDFFLHLGDWTYPDHRNYPGLKIGGNYFYSEDYAKVIQAYEVRYRLPNMAKFLHHTPMDFIHDDDDFVFDGNSKHTHSFNEYVNGESKIGENDLPPGARTNAIKGYNELFPHYPLGNLENGVYHSLRYGQVEIFFLDSRANRSPETGCFKIADGKLRFDPDSTHRMLGKEQMDWLKKGLKNSTATWKFIASGTNFNMGYRQVLDMALVLQDFKLREGVSGATVAAQMIAMWIGYPYDQAELLNFCHEEKIKNVILLSGDAHTSAIDDGTHSGFPELMSGNLGVRNERIASIVYNDMGLNIWNKGGQGIKNENYNNCFGKVEVFGKDSVKLSIIDMYGVTVTSYTQKEGHLVKPVKLKSLLKPNPKTTLRLVANFLKLAGKQIDH